MSRKKNGFWTFVFSLLPGAGEMYLGFFKQGIGLMARFFGVIMFAAYFDFEMLLFVLPIVWFYSFFHVHNLASLPDEEFYAVEDSFLGAFDSESAKDYLQGVRGRRIFGIVLVILGFSVIWNSIRSVVWGFFEYMNPELGYLVSRFLEDAIRGLIAIVIIYLGIQMIRGKKKELNEIEQKEGQGE